MSGDDKITSNRVFPRCFQLEILRRRCSIRSFSEKVTGAGLWPALPPVSGFGCRFFIANRISTNRAKTGQAARARHGCAAAPVPCADDNDGEGRSDDAALSPMDTRRAWIGLLHNCF